MMMFWMHPGQAGSSTRAVQAEAAAAPGACAEGACGRSQRRRRSTGGGPWQWERRAGRGWASQLSLSQPPDGVARVVAGNLGC